MGLMLACKFIWAGNEETFPFPAPQTEAHQAAESNPSRRSEPSDPYPAPHPSARCAPATRGSWAAAAINPNHSFSHLSLLLAPPPPPPPQRSSNSRRATWSSCLHCPKLEFPWALYTLDEV
uniref:Uncharacterized protein n=1 Tax=Oryza glumipatula TaxID=40148 RepID=A0A0D9YIL7_9ORYZ